MCPEAADHPLLLTGARRRSVLGESFFGGFIMIWERNGERLEDCVVFHKLTEQWGGLSNMPNEFSRSAGRWD